MTDQPDRRSALGGFAAAVWALAAAIPAGIAAVFGLDPVLRKKASEGPTLNRIANLSALPDDGTPVDFPVLADKVDAWNRFTNTEIGRVWLRKMPNGQVLAWNAKCPHVGGLIDYKPDAEQFVCPLHHSLFDQSGERVNKVSPRAMDSLEVTVEDDVVFVAYQEFILNTSSKEELA